MACLETKYTPVQKAALTVTPVKAKGLTVTPKRMVAMSIKPAKKSVLTVTQKVKASMDVRPVEKATLEISQVCTISGGELYVLAGTDGPFHTCDGGYFLLDPELETDAE